MLYLIQSINYYKIGYTSNLKSRMSSYKSMNPHVVLLGIKEGTQKDESQYHALYQQYQYYTEWFEFPEDVVQLLLKEFTLDNIGDVETDKSIKNHSIEKENISLFDLKSVIARNVLIWLCKIANSEGEVVLPTARRSKLRNELNISNNQLSNTFKLLKDLNFIEGSGGCFKIHEKIVKNKHLLI